MMSLGGRGSGKGQMQPKINELGGNYDGSGWENVGNATDMLTVGRRTRWQEEPDEAAQGQP